MEDRQDAYLEIVRSLLECEGGTEADILEAHPELVDEGLVMTLKGVAQAMAAKNDPERTSTIEWLTDFAAQLAQTLGLSTESNSGDIESRLRFLMTVFQSIAESSGNPQVIYPLFRDNLALLDESLIPILNAWHQTQFADADEDGKQFLASVLVTFANLIQQFPLGSRLINLEIAIACYEQALSVYTLEAYPEDWAGTQMNLAVAYGNRIRGERAANLEQSIACYELALSVYTLAAYPEDWAMTHMNLANAYRDRIQGERAANLELSIACYELALSVRTREAYPEQWATTQNNLANAYSDRIRGERAANLELSIACYELALSVRTREAYPEDWAMTQMNLATAYSDRIRGERAANLELSISCYEQALSVRTRDADPERWAMTQMNLANAYRNRIRGERAANLEQSIACYELALSVYTLAAYPEKWAGTQMNLAVAYRNRIRGERAANLEQSIACYELALSVRTREAYPEDWATTQMNLANVYGDRIRGERAANLELSIACYELALSVYTLAAYPEDWAMTQMNLAVAYRNRIRGERAANLELSIACYELALSVYTLDAYPEDWAMTQMNLAVAYRNRIRGERAANLELSIACYELALSVYTLEAYPEDWAMTQNNLATAYAGEGKNEEAIEYYQQSLTIFTPATFPINALKANRGLGKIYFTQGEWQLAIDTYAVAIDSAETSRNWATNEDERQRIIREAISVYEHTIQAYINIGRIDLAITTSERARSRQLVDFMRTNDLYPQGRVPERVEEYVAVTKELQQYQQTDLPTDERSLATTSRSYTRSERTAAVIALETKRQDILQEIRQEDAIAAGQMEVIPIEFATIQALIKTTNTAILSFYTTDDDTHIFIITQTGLPQIFTLPGQGFQTFQQWLNQQWSLPYKVDNLKVNIDKMAPEQQQEFIAQVKDIDETLLTSSWKNRMNTNLTAIADRLQLPQLIAQLPDTINEIVIVPHLGLHQIPFAALPLPDSSELLGDRFTIRYVPSCQILQYCTDRPSIESPCHGTVADTDGTLPGSGYESDRIAEIYQILDEFQLRGKQASKANYLDLLTKVNNLLSSHHASSYLDRPKESCLKLADDVLTLGELLGSRYPELNEIFLSCCETHLGDALITDDILTLATGFLCAGARSVIGTLWRVDDLATSIFTIHYYQQRKKGASRSEAIGQSQIYLRNLTKEQIAPLQASLVAYARKIKAEYDNMKKQPPDETTTQMVADLRAVLDAALGLDDRLENFFTIDRPFAEPYYWAAFTCQGL
jgi:CHAT domain-containing protein/tetratricopeptide (TPR) repeat protein